MRVAVIGHLSREGLDFYIEEVEKQMRAGHRVRWFGDGSRLTGYDTEARVELARFTRANREHFDAVVLLVNSKLAAMGVAVANLMVGGFMKAYTNGAEFEKAYNAALDPTAAPRRGA